MARIVYRRHMVVLIALVCSAVIVITCPAKAQPKSNLPRPDAEMSLKQFLQTLDDDKTTKYVAVFRDVNDDGKPETIVYLIGRKWCGSGGCNTVILTRDDGRWRIVTNITITRPPIRVLANTSDGWHSIGVWVQGGGIPPGYEAELRFNGKTYPNNPSVPPAKRSEEKLPGEVVISTVQDAVPLYQEW